MSFLKPKLDNILSGFHKNLEQLQTFVTQSSAKVNEIDAKVELLNNEKEDLSSQITKAKEVSDNIKSLIGDKP